MGTVGGRIMKIIRERLFAAPWAVRRTEERRERGIVAVSAARAWAAEIAQQHAAQPRPRPTALHRRRLERLKGGARRGQALKRKPMNALPAASVNVNAQV
jgi:hypothetical protein